MTSRSKATQERMNKVAQMPCLRCMAEGKGPSPAVIHHCRHNLGVGQKRKDGEIAPLCPEHHRLRHASYFEWMEQFMSDREMHEAVQKELGEDV